MYADYFAELLRSLSAATSRRGILAGLAGGMLAAWPFAPGIDIAEAKQNGKRNKKRRKQKRKNPQQPPPPPTPPPAPVVRADAACSGLGNTFFGAGGDNRLAQTFTAIASGPLVRAELDIVKSQGSVGDYILQLGTVDTFGVPTNDVLAAAFVENRSVPDGESTVTFSFATPFAVVAGVRYALVLSRAGADLTWRATVDDTCAGQAFASLDRTAPFEPFAPFDEVPDFIFTTFVGS